VNILQDEYTLGAAALLGSLILAALTARWYVRPVGRHRAPRPVPAVDPATVWLQCDSTRCAHLTTRHLPTGEDSYRCTSCGTTSEGAQ
jgi:hypothetical protein